MILLRGEQTMKLLIDIGNTNTSIAVIGKNKKIKKRYFIHTGKSEVRAAALKRLIGKDLKAIESICIVSVVPKFLKLIKKNLKHIAPKIPILVIGKDIKVPMVVKYKNPREVGQDRLVVSFAARRLVGTPLIVVDFGTAVTFDFVNAKGEYVGGLIFPGLRLALESLVKSAALLPNVTIKASKGLLGKDTKSSINKGILLGYAAVCDNFIKRLKDKYGHKTKVVATGGDAGLISKYSREIKRIYPDLIFTGLNYLSE